MAGGAPGVAVIRLALLYGFMVALGFGAGAAACYDTTAPAPPCTVNSSNPACYPFPHDMQAPDAGR